MAWLPHRHHRHRHHQTALCVSEQLPTPGLRYLKDLGRALQEDEQAITGAAKHVDP